MDIINIKGNRPRAIELVTALDATLGNELDRRVSDYYIQHVPLLPPGRKLDTLLTNDPRLNVIPDENEIEIVFAFYFFDTTLEGEDTQVREAWVVNVTHHAIVEGTFQPTKH